MFDTVAISKSTFALPDFQLLESRGCKVFYNGHTGKPYKLALNGEKRAKLPRITISKSPKELWIIKAEASVGAWLYDSNIFLPDEKDIEKFLHILSEYVGDQTGYKFEAQLERVTRFDPARNFEVGESRILSILKQLNNIVIPRYDRKPINNNSVYFENRGKSKNKKYSIYSKSHDLKAKGATDSEIELATGLLRFEVQHKDNRAVANAARSLKYSDHSAKQILTRRTSEQLIQKGMDLLSFEKLLECPDSVLETLALSYGSSNALKLAGHLTYKQQFGNDYHNLPFIDLSANTVKSYEKQCAKAGVLSLE